MSNSLPTSVSATNPLRQFWRRLKPSPLLPEPENSIALRVMVQCLVTVGIVAIDMAAADVAAPLWISVWAIPASGIGAWWSWRRRRHRNVFVKFCIAIAMLLALAAFFLRLVNSPNDTRLALAELLIQLQVFHSFDLPRRKDLGYSIMIGLILVGVSATLSQTLLFGPILLAFLAIALPTLMLDYRSRLGLAPRSLTINELDPRRFLPMLLLVVGLGLAVFASLPRLPGYQLRTFPVSAPIEFQGEFDRSSIINPGYVREGSTAPLIGTGESGQGQGAGTLNSDHYYGFNSRINQNLRGQLTPRLVMRVRSQAEGFWRVMAFDRYTGQGWEVSRNSETQVETLRRPEWTFRFNVPWSVTLNKTQEVVQSYTMVSDLPNLLPVLYEPKEVYFPTRELAQDLEGALRSPIPLSEGLTYTVVSEVPRRDRTRLRQSPRQYPQGIIDHYLQMPEAIAPRLRQTTQDILAAAPTAIADPYETALYLAQYLKQNYRVQPELPFLSEGQDLAESFLFEAKGGYPDHFSTVLTLMLRSVGIPARLVVGYGSGNFNPFTGFYEVRNTDAFAMTEVYFQKFGWFTFNPIPGMEVVPPSVEEVETFSVLSQFWNWVAGWLPSPVTAVISAIASRMFAALGWAIAALTRLVTQGWLGLLIGLGLLLGAGVLVWLAVRGWQTLREWGRLSRLAPMEAVYQRLLRQLAAQGDHKHPAQTPLEFAHQMGDRYPDLPEIREICSAYVGWRYGGESADVSVLQRQLKHIQSRFNRWQVKPH